MILLIKNLQYIRGVRVNQHIRKSISSKATRNTEDYEYIQRSRLPTMFFQPSLPRLPIPKLEESCRRYLKAQQPILTPMEWKRTSDYVTEFLGHDGPQLHKQLIERDLRNKHTSYISELWFDMYLRDRKPLPINYNPHMVMIQETNSSYNEPLVKGTNLLIASARFMKSLRAGILEPEIFHLNPQKSDTELFKTFMRFLPTSIATYGAYVFKAFPLDMSQFVNLFGTTRIPSTEKDTLSHDYTCRHVVVMRRGHFYSMDLLDTDGKIRSPSEIAASLHTIMNDPRESNPFPVGLLTATRRDEWAEARRHLADIGNDYVFRKIDSAAFIFVIDDDVVGTDYHKLLRLFMHGDGKNRWFDKSFSLIMSGDGVAGINFEHSWGDGVAVLRYFKDLKRDIANNPKFHPENVFTVVNDTSLIEKLDFIVDDVTKSTIDRVLNEYQEWTLNQLTVDYLICEDFGKEECKKFGISPDAVMQLAFQLALYKLERRAVATYESCSTSAFRHGRTETIRSCTNETKALCSAIVEQGPSNIRDVELKKLMMECSRAHTVLTKEAAMGQGFDRHLFALKKQWEMSNDKKKILAIYADKAYTTINHNILSTSTLSSPEVWAGGFGPVVDDGYGIAYMIQDHRLGSVITGYRQHRDASDYVENLKSSFEDIRRILKGK